MRSCSGLSRYRWLNAYLLSVQYWQDSKIYFYLSRVRFELLLGFIKQLSVPGRFRMHHLTSIPKIEFLAVLAHFLFKCKYNASADNAKRKWADMLALTASSWLFQESFFLSTASRQSVRKKKCFIEDNKMFWFVRASQADMTHNLFQVWMTAWRTYSLSVTSDVRSDLPHFSKCPAKQF